MATVTKAADAALATTDQVLGLDRPPLARNSSCVLGVLSFYDKIIK